MMRIDNIEKINKANNILSQFVPSSPITDRIDVLEIAINSLKARKRSFAPRRS